MIPTIANIRTAKLDDLEGLVVLFEAYRKFYRMAPDEAAAHTFLENRLLNADATIYVAALPAKELVGFAQLYPLFSSTQMKQLWLLNDLFVASNFRGKGIGVQLIEQAQLLTRESGAAGLMLETEKTNHIGNQLYPKMGFQLDEDHHYYTYSVKDF